MRRSILAISLSRVVAAGMAAAALGCVSASDLDGIETRLSDIEVQTLKLQKQNADRDQLLAVEKNLENRIDKVTSSHADIQADVDHLSLQVERLQSKLDETNFQLSQLIQQIKAVNLELQSIRTVAEQAGRSQGARPSSSRTSAARLDETDPQALYDTAYDDYLAGSYDLAILGFSRYLDHHVDTELADNATYWLGECYYHLDQYRRAVDQFAKVLQFSGSDRIPSAHIKKAYAHLELGQNEAGRQDLNRVACDFAGTDEALLAEQRLTEMGFDPDC